MTTAITTQQIVEAYGAAWNEPDQAKRRALLDQAWADGGVYTDPQSHVEGREARRLRGLQLDRLSLAERSLRCKRQLEGFDGSFGAE